MKTSEPVNILVVDDMPEKIMAIEATLEELGQNIVKAYSGREALRCLLKDDFAVILLDVNMPEMDGFETAALIRERKRSEHTPIIFVTAFNDDVQIAKGYSLGAVDFISTPIDPEVLRTKVGVFVDLYQKTETIRQQAAHRVQLAREQAARQVAEKAMRRYALLAEASRLLSRSLDFDATLTSLHRTMVPALADGCQLVLYDVNRTSGLPTWRRTSRRGNGKVPVRIRASSRSIRDWPKRCEMRSRAVTPSRSIQRSFEMLPILAPRRSGPARSSCRSLPATRRSARLFAAAGPRRQFEPADLALDRKPGRPGGHRTRQCPALSNHSRRRAAKRRIPGDARARAAKPAGRDHERRRADQAARTGRSQLSTNRSKSFASKRR